MTPLRINPICVVALFLALAPMPLMGRSFLSPIKSSVILGTDSIVIADVKMMANRTSSLLTAWKWESCWAMATELSRTKLFTILAATGLPLPSEI